MLSRCQAVFCALCAAALFGATTPIAKALLGELPPLMVAGLFYFGSGLGLSVAMLIRHLASMKPDTRRPPADRRMGHAEWAWLLGAIFVGGVAGQAALMLGLAQISAAVGALLLNLEGVFTVVIAWAVLRENVDRRIAIGMAAIVAGGMLLTWHPGAQRWSTGAVLVAGACLCWGIDNNMTRRVSARDAMFVAGLRGMVAGAIDVSLAFGLGARFPVPAVAAAAMATGFVGYGVSFALGVLSMRNLGAARACAYFSVAPLFGVALSLFLRPAVPSPLWMTAAALMVAGVWLHVRERHEHEHTHELLEHSHPHRHDEHHRHEHDFDWDGSEPHTHWHRHEPMTHTHPHFPDIHHRHRH